MSTHLSAQLDLPEPEIHLQAAGATPTDLTASILAAYGTALQARRPQAVLVVGDVSSTLACALAAKQHGLPLIHVEAGLRSGDRSMPEELNRIATDHFSDLLLTTTDQASQNLFREGIAPERVHLVGNTMVDTLLKYQTRAIQPPLFEAHRLDATPYLLLTLHRPSNVDEAQVLQQRLRLLGDALPGTPVVFPVHPRTARQLRTNSLPANILLLPPQPYLQFLYLQRHCQGVLTDSGGVSEEATILKKPCLVFRSTTERPETVVTGTTELAATDASELLDQLRRIRSGDWASGSVPDRWDGRAGSRVVRYLAGWLPQAVAGR